MWVGCKLLRTGHLALIKRSNLLQQKRPKRFTDIPTFRTSPLTLTLAGPATQLLKINRMQNVHANLMSYVRWHVCMSELKVPEFQRSRIYGELLSAVHNAWGFPRRTLLWHQIIIVRPHAHGWVIHKLATACDYVVWNNIDECDGSLAMTYTLCLFWQQQFVDATKITLNHCAVLWRIHYRKSKIINKNTQNYTKQNKDTKLHKHKDKDK